MNAAILGLGQWLPEDVRTNDFWSDEIVTRWRARAEASTSKPDQKTDPLPDATLATVPEAVAGEFVSRQLEKERLDPLFGTTRRHVARPTDSSCEASAHAGRSALDDAGIAPEEVDVVLSFEAVPDRPAMTGAAKIAALAKATRAIGITADSACASAIVQLELACALIESGRARCVLCTQSFLATTTYPVAHPVLPTLGDAATAFVVGPSTEPSVLGVYSHSDGRYYDGVCWVRGRTDETDTPWWTAGGAFMYGSREPPLAVEIIRNTVPWGARALRAAAERARVAPSSLDVMVSVHPRRWIPGGIAETLGLPSERAVHTFDQTAHTGGCCLVTNLLEARQRGLLRKDKLIGMYAQGLGFTSSAAVLRWGRD